MTMPDCLIISIKILDAKFVLQKKFLLKNFFFIHSSFGTGTGAKFFLKDKNLKVEFCFSKISSKSFLHQCVLIQNKSLVF